ncbi:tRNA (adenosine(37)-N6)-threonylcarbamoyltransferase complex dimerization subunit type 1 TsaB [Leuconostocaceae bacterium ESL0723]|nr:tRNA (adenosine(37)-N6)-threonylcarbamoyltransferase complex dimerization subunit type 1 TsaB [Leuconostocaceae bacterium ESL0723]
MKILAFDTSNQAMTVSLAEDQHLVQTYQTNVARNHSVELLPAIQEVLKRQGWQLKDLDRLVVAEGPGSFTGLRIGLTVAKVLADTLKVPLVDVSSLAILAEQVPGDGYVLPLFDARNNNVFAGIYQDGQAKLPDEHYPIAQILSWLHAHPGQVTVIGDGQNFKERFEQAGLKPDPVILSPEDSLPNGQGIVTLGYQGQPVADLADFTPNYLRKTQAEMNWLAQHPDEDHPENYVFEV